MIFLLPLLGLIGFLFLAFLLKPRWPELLCGLFFFCGSFAAGSWAILQSRSSTAGIGFLFLPFPSLAAGALAMIFWKGRKNPSYFWRLAAWLALLLATGVIGFEIFGGIKSIRKNLERDRNWELALKKMQANKESIKNLLRAHPGHEAEALTHQIEEKIDDRNFVIPALETPFVDPQLLDRLSQSNDLGIALSAIQNPAASEETLRKVYQTHSNPHYFFQALASHPHTPPDILIRIYREPPVIMGLNRSFARNPAIPPEILQELSKDPDINVIQGLLKNPKLDCRLLRNVQQSLQHSSRPEDSYSRSRIMEVEKNLCPEN